MTIASPRQPEGAAQGARRLWQLWTWVSRCDASGCDERPVHLGWCARHTPADDPAPDEYWG
ncbi:hypothetical protein [Pseudonocardia zijingensis]|jgi:hypothetical protein|uniref:Uncharacterized protein n=1 Tax=Pseudonocardia zijingensis TaxID=153376 RepID=A0ABP3ZH26_9PSEU